MKTRADLKRELEQTVPHGEEQAVVDAANAALEAARANVKSLRAERARLMRQISIRERKMSDWKGKIPRADEPTMHAAEEELARAGTAVCQRVANLVADEHGRVARLQFHPEFRRALTGVDGFDKLWVVAWAPDGVALEGSCRIAGAADAPGENVYLWLAHICSADVTAGIVHISGLDFLTAHPALAEIAVLDVKPYLPYCDALPAAPNAPSQSAAPAHSCNSGAP